MRDDSDSRDLVIIDEDLPPSSFLRWLPTMVVLSAIIGFMSLSWYAYHAGMQSLKDDDLLVVEADKTPIKEKPVDPGGMKFPNQDKTVFETFASGAQTPAKVERVLPTPEEPMAKQADTSETSSWVNDKLHKDKPTGKTEQVMMKKDEKPISDNDTESYIAPTAAKAVAAKPAEKPAVKAEAKPAAKEEKKEDKKVVTKIEKTEPSEGSAAAAEPEADDSVAEKPLHKIIVQLGAYRSEKEAQDAWDHMQKKNPILSDEVPLIVKADLGSKGIYYRLRITNFPDTAQANSLCSKLAAHQQACVLVP